MERRDFLSNVGITLAIAATAGLAACSKGGDDPAPGGGNPGGGNPGGGNPGGSTPRLTVNLNTQIPNVGDFIISSGVVLVRLATGNVPASFAAVTSTCTHMGCTLFNYDKSTQKIECTSSCGHGSRFNTDGSVSNGPATAALTKYTVEISGTTLNVK